MLKRSVLLAVLAAAVVSFVGPAGAITGNYQDDFVHDNVGLLVFYAPNTPAGHNPFSHRCSGTLISATVMVTAGHCTEGVDSGRVYFQQSTSPNYDPTAFGGFGGDPATGYPFLNGVTFSRADNYGFHDFAGFPDTHDVGVIVLDQPVTPANGFGILPRPGQIDAYAAGSKKDARFIVSGYGLSDQDPVVVSFRKRLMAESYLVNNEAPVTDVQPEDDRERLAGQGRDLQRGLRRTGVLQGHERDRGGQFVRSQRPVQGPRLLLPARPGARSRLGQRSESGRRRLAQISPKITIDEGPLRRALGLLALASGNPGRPSGSRGFRACRPRGR